ncbi:Uncharacterised protein [Salmonella enterica subsp. enterica]|uniref:Uncharacterized protein n=1 Tax=Salmonella enterica I TaxID=59201 RepID=A0A3S4G1P3_SALET|nr:Uncharacterised protein [Salmonella enterica subsp. enterica]
MKIAANRDLRGMSLDSEKRGFIQSTLYIVRVYVKRRLAIQER